MSLARIGASPLFKQCNWGRRSFEPLTHPHEREHIEHRRQPSFFVIEARQGIPSGFTLRKADEHAFRNLSHATKLTITRTDFAMTRIDPLAELRCLCTCLSLFCRLRFNGFSETFCQHHRVRGPGTPMAIGD